MALDVKSDSQRLKEMMKKSFDKHFETELYTLRFHLLDHNVGNHRKFGILCVLNSFTSEQYILHIKNANCATSRRRYRGLEETVGMVNSRPICTTARLKSTFSGLSDSSMNKQD